MAVRCQRPRVRGDSFGRAEPSTAASGLENVSRIEAAAASRAPGNGLLTSTGERAGGNQLTTTGAPSRSHERAAAATSTEPAAARRPNAIERCALSSSRNARWPPATSATALTDRSNRTRTSDPTETVSQRSLTCATGARSVNPSRRLLPSTHASQPGRRITTTTDTRSPGINCTPGVRRPPRTKSGIVRPSGPDARCVQREGIELAFTAALQHLVG